MLNNLIEDDEDVDRPLGPLLPREVDVDEELHQRAPDQRDQDEDGRHCSLDRVKFTINFKAKYRRRLM